MISNQPSLNGSPQIDKPLHVLTITPFYPTKGDDSQGCFVAEPLPWIAALGTTNSVIAAQPFYRRRVEPGDSAPPVHWSYYFSLPGGIGLPVSGRFLFSSILSKVTELNRKCPIDLIHAHAALPCGHAALLLSQRLKIPFVVTAHGLDVFFTNQVAGPAGAWCKRICQRVYGSAQKVICISQRVQEEVSRGVTANTAVIYNGVDTTRFAPAKNPKSPPVILCVANLIPIKGHELLLHAFAAIHPQYPEVCCEVIGGGPERARLNRLVNELDIANKVHFLGRRSRTQVAEAMGRCLLFALPSRYEGLGCVYLEAMSSGKAVIACKGQGIQEIISHESNGWLIDPDNLPAMTDALSRLLQDSKLRLKIEIAARHTVEQQFTLSHQATALVRLYRECVA
jgi:glycosyltransferase involved in cell wall biosynthesis